jgi:hypothetical protein
MSDRTPIEERELIRRMREHVSALGADCSSAWLIADHAAELERGLHLRLLAEGCNQMVTWP